MPQRRDVWRLPWPSGPCASSCFSSQHGKGQDLSVAFSSRVLASLLSHLLLAFSSYLLRDTAYLLSRISCLVISSLITYLSIAYLLQVCFRSLIAYLQSPISDLQSLTNYLYLLPLNLLSLTRHLSSLTSGLSSPISHLL